jgi:hypothetical protein
VKYGKKSFSGISALVFILFILVFFAACPSPNSGSIGPVLDPPKNVFAGFENNIPKVSWDAASDADQYLVYRKAGDGPFLPVENVGSTSFTDTSFPKDKKLQYAVQSRQNDIFSNLSSPSNYISLYVQNVRATQLEYTDKIRVTWDIHPDPVVSFKVYRYLSKDGQNPQIYFDISDNYFEDTASNGIQAGTPYFYRVSWVDGDGEHGKDGFYSLGVFNGLTDIGEPNNDVSEAKDLSFVSDIKEFSVDASIFSFSDGIGSSMSDTDWYVFKKTSGESRTLFVTVNFPSGSQFNGKLRLRFFHNGQFEGSGAQTLYADNKPALFDLAAGADTVYFVVDSNIPSTYSLIESYTITTSYEM